jgi:DNA-binding XRE family transcriptional regulator
MDSPVQIITGSDGKPVFAVLPIGDYEALLERADENLSQHAFDAFEATRPETFPDEIAERLLAGNHPVRVYREYRRLSQGELAALAHTTQTTVSQIENRKRIGSEQMLRAIAKALKVEMDDSWYGL